MKKTDNSNCSNGQFLSLASLVLPTPYALEFSICRFTEGDCRCLPVARTRISSWFFVVVVQDRSFLRTSSSILHCPSSYGGWIGFHFKSELVFLWLLLWLKNGRMGLPGKNEKALILKSDHQTICFSNYPKKESAKLNDSHVLAQTYSVPMQSRHFLCIHLTRPCIIREDWHRLLSLTGRSILHASLGNHCEMAFLVTFQDVCPFHA